MNGEKMSNGRVFIEVPVSENAFDLLRLMQMPGEHVTATAARILEDALQAQTGIEPTAEGAEPSRESLLKRVEEALQEVDELIERLPLGDALHFGQSVCEVISRWESSESAAAAA